jgi:ComF family protein
MEGEDLCADCMRKLVHLSEVKRQVPDDFSQLAGECRFDSILTCWPYSGELEKIVHWIKYRRGTRLGHSMGIMMGSMVVHLPDDFGSALCIPVPLHRTRQRERGFNQSEVLVRGLSSTLGCQVDVTSLIRSRYTATQTRLSGPERRKNVQDAFKVREAGEIKGRHVLLVDDVCTTGATLNSCSCALKESGAETVTGIALARPQISKEPFLP